MSFFLLTIKYYVARDAYIVFLLLPESDLTVLLLESTVLELLVVLVESLLISVVTILFSFY